MVTLPWLQWLVNIWYLGSSGDNGIPGFLSQTLCFHRHIYYLPDIVRLPPRPARESSDRSTQVSYTTFLSHGCPAPRQRQGIRSYWRDNRGTEWARASRVAEEARTPSSRSLGLVFHCLERGKSLLAVGEQMRIALINASMPLLCLSPSPSFALSLNLILGGNSFLLT